MLRGLVDVDVELFLDDPDDLALGVAGELRRLDEVE